MPIRKLSQERKDKRFIRNKTKGTNLRLYPLFYHGLRDYSVTLNAFVSTRAFHNEAKTEIARMLAIIPSEMPTGIL